MSAGKKSTKPASSDAEPLSATLDLNSSVPVLVTILANRITTSGSITFRRLHGIGSTEWKVLSTIAIEPHVTGARICQLVGLDRGAVSRVLKGFVERGLIQVDQNARHSNYQSVSLTVAGQLLHEEAVLTAFEREKILLKPFTAKQQLQFVEMLRKLIDQSRLLAQAG
ncbi:MAG TPA: MarR family winged helix-turn-helix transcriptional regulator [Sphingobium sp.]